MEKNVITASLSTQNLTFRPGDPPVSFEVIVNNDSDEFANFQIEIVAAGETRNPAYRWYRLEPEIAAAQPHGSSTKFQVFIVNTPIPGFVGTANLTVKIFSPQLGQERRLLLRLKIEPDNKPTSLSVEFPIREFQVYPRNTVDIPVRVRNLGQQLADVTLRFAGVDVSWLVGSAERRLRVDPGGQAEVSFQCQPPSVVQSPSQNYLLRVEAISNNGYPANAEGNLEVLPVGYVEFTASQKQQKIPSKRRWLPNFKSDTASFELLFKNVSNLRQEINVKIQGRDFRKCTFSKYPETADLKLGETCKLILDVKTKRPWVGIGKTLQLEASSELSDQRLGSTDPATQTLELQVLPIIPLWLQLAILALIAALLALLFSQEPIMHTASVNSVSVSGIGSSVISGSDDCTLRLWRIGTDKLTPDETITFDGQPVACGKPQKPKGLLALANDKVRVLRLIPVENNRVAVGLDNGIIELKNVLTGKNSGSYLNSGGDRVFDLAFTTNSLHLFSGHGSGNVRIWSRPSVNQQFKLEPQVINLREKKPESGDKLPFEVRALALGPDDKTLVIAGNFKRFILLPLNLGQIEKQSVSVQKLDKLDGKGGRNDFIWGLAFAPNSNSSNKILATSDSAGFITIWDLNKCQIIKNANPQEVSELNCTPLERWQDKSKIAVRTLAFSEDSRVIVSGGDDGRIVVWYLNSDYTLNRKKSPEGIEIYQSPKQSNNKTNSINSIYLIKGIVVSGSEDFQVKQHRIK